MRQKSSLLLIVCLLSFSAACSGGLQKKQLVGRWGASKDATNAWDFKSDGTVQVVDKAAGGGERTVATGSYIVSGSETIVFHWMKDSPSLPPQVKVTFGKTGDLMFMTLPDTGLHVYVRVN